MCVIVALPLTVIVTATHLIHLVDLVVRIVHA
jgi:hypothetical protein